MHDALHGADTDTQLSSDFLDAFSLSTRRSDPFLDDLRRAGPAEGLALGASTLESGANPLANHGPLEFGVMRSTA
jgi:hypothetical protein